MQYFALKVLNIFNKLCKYFASFARITDITPNIEAGPIDNWVCQKNTFLNNLISAFETFNGKKCQKVFIEPLTIDVLAKILKINDILL